MENLLYELITCWSATMTSTGKCLLHFVNTKILKMPKLANKVIQLA